MRRKTACTIQFSKSLAEASMDTIAYWGQRLRAGCNSFHPAASSRERRGLDGDYGLSNALTFSPNSARERLDLRWYPSAPSSRTSFTTLSFDELVRMSTGILRVTSSDFKERNFHA